MTAPSAAGLVNWPQLNNLVSLDNNLAKGLGIVSGLGPPVVDFKDIKCAPIKITTGATVSAGATASLFIFGSEDGTSWPYGIDPTSPNDQYIIIRNVGAVQQINTRNLVQTINCAQPNTAYYFDWLSVLQRLNTVPTCSALLISNNTGGPFAATLMSGSTINFDAKYRTIQFG